MNKLKFLSESLKNIKTIGTVTRSSKFLCEKMVSYVDFENSKVVVELGAGDGVVTEHILRKMRDDAVLLTFEVNSKFCAIIREKIKDKRMIVIEDSAERLPFYLEEYGLSEVDNVISAIPFVSLPDALGEKIVSICKDCMKPKSRFVQIHYSLLSKKLYEKVFGNLDINYEVRNIPPAFVFVCEKR